MNVKEAVALAKQHVMELFAEEKITNLGLEEVELDDQSNEWAVTVGFSRPWDEPRNALAALSAPAFTRRTFKVVRISNQSSQVVSVKKRDVQRES